MTHYEIITTRFSMFILFLWPSGHALYRLGA
jgi:hypothetical protein